MRSGLRRVLNFALHQTERIKDQTITLSLWESVGQLGLDPSSTCDVNLHYAIAHMRRADGAFPPSAKGKKALDLLAGKGQSRCGVVARQICDALPE